MPHIVLISRKRVASTRLNITTVKLLPFQLHERDTDVERYIMGRLECVFVSRSWLFMTGTSYIAYCFETKSSIRFRPKPNVGPTASMKEYGLRFWNLDVKNIDNVPYSILKYKLWMKIFIIDPCTWPLSNWQGFSFRGINISAIKETVAWDNLSDIFAFAFEIFISWTCNCHHKLCKKKACDVTVASEICTLSVAQWKVNQIWTVRY